MDPRPPTSETTIKTAVRTEENPMSTASLGCRWRGLVFVAAAMLAALALSACGSSSESGSSSGSDSDSGSKPLLVSINKLGTLQYFIEQAEGFKTKAKELGAEARTADVELDSEKAVTEVQNAISSGAAGIAITVPDQELGPRVIELARQANVPLIAADDTIEDQEGKEAPFIGYDDTKMGQLVGGSAAEYLNEEGWVKEGDDVGILSVEVQTLSVCQDRTEAATEVMLDEVQGLKSSDVIHVPYDGSTEDALKAVPPVLTAHPEVEKWVIYACNDEGVAGALRALEQDGTPTSSVIGVGLGATTACEDWKAGRKTGFRAALWLNGHDVGEAAAEELYKAATESASIPASTYAPVQMVTAQTYKKAGVTC